MKQWSIDIFRKNKSTTVYFDDQYDAIRYAIKAAQKEPKTNIYMLEKFFDDKYDNIVLLYEGKEA